MTKLTACVASLSVFVAYCISFGADPLELADTSFLQDNSTGNVSVAEYYDDSCVYEFNYQWFDLRGIPSFQVASATTIATF